MKKCSKCGTEKQLTKENYSVRKGSKDGFRNDCKECRRRYNKEYYQENRERLMEKNSKYYKENIDKMRKYHAEYHQANRERIIEKGRIHYKENRERLLEDKREYYRENKEKIAESDKRYYEKNKKKIAERSSRYHKNNRVAIAEKDREYYNKNKEAIIAKNIRYRKDNPLIHQVSRQRRIAKQRELPYTLTQNEWREIKGHFNDSCAYCGLAEDEHKEKANQQLHQDHFVPLSEGGEYTHNNIIPACNSCNSSKGNKDFFEWYKIHASYDKEREDFILEYLGYEENTQQLSIL